MKKPIETYRHLKKENHLFNYLMKINKFTRDAELARWLFTSTSIISLIRNDKISLSPRLILRIYDTTDLTIEDIRKMANMEVE